MTKLIIGCGYLGRRVAELWRGRGERVVGTTRTAGRAAELAGMGLEPVLCDVLEPASLDRLPGSDGVLYCVGLDRAAGMSMQRVYVEGLANVLGRLQGAARLVYISSTGVYGQTDGEEVDEDADTEPAEPSGQVVLAAERLLRQHRPDAIVLRFAGIYGPGRLPRAETIRQGEPLDVDPEKWVNLIHVEDGAAAVVAAMERGRPGAVYNISDGRPVRRGEFYQRLAEVLGVGPPRFVPPRSVERANRRITNGRMRQELGVALRYPSFEEGLAALK